MRDKDEDDSPKKGTVIYKILIVVFLLVLLGGIYVIDTQLGKGYIKNAIETVAGIKGKDKTKTVENKPVTAEANATSSGEEALAGSAVSSSEGDLSGATSSGEGITIGETEEPKNNDDKKNNLNKSMEFESNSKSTFAIMNKGFAHCSKDGVKYYNTMEDQKWNSTFTMTSPVMVAEGEYFAVGESGGKNVKVYNGDGEVYSVKTEGTVSRIAINKNGYTAVMSSMTDYYRIQVFDNKGTEITKREEKDKGVYPLDVDISDDNSVIAVSYVDTTDVTMMGKVLFFYAYKEQGKEYADAMFAAVQKEDEIIPEIEFMNGNKLVCVTDKSLYAFNLKGDQAWEIKLLNKIQAVSFEGKDKTVVAYGEPFGGTEGFASGKVEWIDTNGKVTGSFDGSDSITYLKAGKGGAVIGNHNTYKAIAENGKELWEYKAKQDITDILFMNGTSNVLVVTKTSAEIMDMNKSAK